MPTVSYFESVRLFNRLFFYIPYKIILSHCWL